TETTRLEKSGISLQHAAAHYIDRLRHGGVPNAFLSDGRGNIWLALEIAAEALYFERETGNPAKRPTRSATGKYSGVFLEHLRRVVSVDAAEDREPVPTDAALVNKLKTTIPVLRRWRKLLI